MPAFNRATEECRPNSEYALSYQLSITTMAHRSEGGNACRPERKALKSLRELHEGLHITLTGHDRRVVSDPSPVPRTINVPGASSTFTAADTIFSGAALLSRRLASEAQRRGSPFRGTGLAREPGSREGKPVSIVDGSLVRTAVRSTVRESNRRGG